ncbi:Gfo/Idh/MocA family oxidoreductase [Sphingomonas sp. 37zxx]|uniref:Gfo/Idh/MocA family oxidoreductase n=1 Tax=Sphingomonas sp. 37zxx TaxID=1550073 RepID=UPI0018CCE020|nr:Gfo/Idh/MocA family oxidoreductase [Sphingomonas sp. 37zxx]
MTSIRYGMIGGGQGAFIGGIHRTAAAIAGNWQLVAGALSSTPEKAIASGQELGLPADRTYSSWAEMLAREADLPDDVRIEAVAIVTPNHMQAPPAIAALEAGLDVIIDKMVILFAAACYVAGPALVLFAAGAEPFKRPTFWIFFAIVFLTASAELAPGAWVDVTLSQTVGMPGILVLVYVSAIMFVMRHFAGPLDHRFSDMGLLCVCTLPAAAGLYLLSAANSPTTALVAATLWAIGVCFMWPTMLAAVSRRFPKSGPWGTGLVGFAGAMVIYFVLPQLGEIYDDAKLAKAGGREAFNALVQGSPEMQGVRALAAETSFQTIAVIPLILFFVFGLVWFFERGKSAK